MSLTTAGKNASSSTTIPKSAAPSSPFIIRRAPLTEGYRIGWIAARGYDNTPIINGLSPHRDRFPHDYVRAFQQRNTARMFDPRNINFVAAEASNPSVAIGYIQLLRMGDDEGARRRIAAARSAWVWFLGWVFWAYCVVVNFFMGADRSLDREVKMVFSASMAQDLEVHFKDRPERVNRWYVQSCVVLPEFQGRGVAKRLMWEVISRAEEEGVPITLEASAAGEKLYERVGFKLLGRYTTHLFGEGGNAGGEMMYTPSTWREKMI